MQKKAEVCVCGVLYPVHLHLAWAKMRENHVEYFDWQA